MNNKDLMDLCQLNIMADNADSTPAIEIDEGTHRKAIDVATKQVMRRITDYTCEMEDGSILPATK